MAEMSSRRRKAIIKRRIFVSACAVVLALVIALVVFIVSALTSDNKKPNDDKPSNDIVADADKDTESKAEEPEVIIDAPEGLDPYFECLLLVNGTNPLPDTYDSEVREYLVEIDPQYRNNNYVTQIHEDVYPYITAMVAAAQKEGVDLRVWSPFRSYAIQNDLFQKQVDRVGGDEEKAATVVARPGTSEHNTGLCADFNMASDAFEKTPMYTWMQENAEDYGFIMRYREDKQPLTGVIHESWHWRFVGIKHAREMNRLDMCLEEYVEYLKKN